MVGEKGVGVSDCGEYAWIRGYVGQGYIGKGMWVFFSWFLVWMG